jgi:hypothetical protein
MSVIETDYACELSCDYTTIMQELIAKRKAGQIGVRAFIKKVRQARGKAASQWRTLL